MTSIPKTRAIELLQAKIGEIEALQSHGPTSEEFIRWKNSTATTIKNVFLNDSTRWNEFQNIRYRPSSCILAGDIHRVFREAFLRGLSTARATLQAMIEEIQTFWPDDAPPAPATPTPPPLDSRKVFLVHGRDTAAKEAVARFLEHLDLRPIILSEQPNGGKTMIEKYEREANNASYAVVLFTPDDIGGLQSADEQQARVRQNVIFELGYFAGRLGRERVCILTDPSVEIPSDIFGLGYVPFDSSGDGWKIGLGRELKNAGFDIDANKAFS